MGDAIIENSYFKQCFIRKDGRKLYNCYIAKFNKIYHICIPSLGGSSENQDKSEAINDIQKKLSQIYQTEIVIYKCNCKYGILYPDCFDIIDSLINRKKFKNWQSSSGKESAFAFTFNGLNEAIAKYLIGELSWENSALHDAILDHRIIISTRNKEEEILQEERRRFSAPVSERDRSLVHAVRLRDKSKCIYCENGVQCKNTFLTERALPFIEVHHVEPLNGTKNEEKGEDNVKNMVCLCSHHHSMAHYADAYTRKSMQDDFKAYLNKIYQ